LKLKREIEIKHVLFVCTANRCRSVMAEWGFRDFAKRRELWHVTVSSAGMVAPHGAPPTETALEVLSERGIDASGHGARLLDRSMVDEANVVLGMTRAHVRAIASLAPGVEEKTFLLGEFSADDGDSEVDDPFGLGIEDYRECFNSIESCFAGLAEYLEGGTV
jgi:protein-tyrosine phosphatase